MSSGSGSVIVAIPQPRAAELAAELELEGIDSVTVTSSATIDAELLAGARVVVVPASRSVLTAELVAVCDRSGVRILALGGSDSRMTARLGIPAALPADAGGWQVARAITEELSHAPNRATPDRGRVVAVWGPHGSPGRTTVAIQLAVELRRSGRSTALIDADTVAPSVALLLGLGDDAPGIAAACRRAELGGLDSAELTRLAATVRTSAGDLEVLAGINRPSRWPELSEARIGGTLRASRGWTDQTVVDVAGAFDADDELTHDLSGPRRHAATVAVLQEADTIVAVASADPLGISRFLRDHAELRRIVGSVPISVVINRVRSGPLGIDARGQVRRTLERFAGIDDVTFLPLDQRAADASLLHARPMADVTPRSALVAAVRRLSATLVPTDGGRVTADSSRGSSPVARRLRSALGARGA